MNAVRALFLGLLLCWSWAGAAAADVPVPPLTGRVVDQTGTLSAGDVASITATLQDLEQRKGSQIAVLIVPTTQPETIEQFSIRVADAWKIGRKGIDDGALLVVAKDDRRLRIEVGYGLEGGLTDLTARRIIDEVITPRFRFGDFAGGISAGVARMAAVIEGEALPPPSTTGTLIDGEGDLGWLALLNPFSLLIFLAIGSLFRQTLGRLVGSVAAGGVAGFLVWLLAGSLIAAVLTGLALMLFSSLADGMFNQSGINNNRARRGRGGGWVVGPIGGGWSSGGIGGGGGFSGWGGGFGGGGASGSW